MVDDVESEREHGGLASLAQALPGRAWYPAGTPLAPRLTKGAAKLPAGESALSPVSRSASSSTSAALPDPAAATGDGGNGTATGGTAGRTSSGSSVRWGVE